MNTSATPTARSATEARDVDPTYTPATVNTDGWKATQKAWRTLFSTIAVVLCFLHGFLKIRDRSRKDHELHRRIWEVYRAATKGEFSQTDASLSPLVARQVVDHTGPRGVGETLEPPAGICGELPAPRLSSDQQSCGPADEPALPGVVRRSRLARAPSIVGTSPSRLGIAAELSPLCPAQWPASRLSKPRPRTQSARSTTTTGFITFRFPPRWRDTDNAHRKR